MLYMPPVWPKDSLLNMKNGIMISDGNPYLGRKISWNLMKI